MSVKKLSVYTCVVALVVAISGAAPAGQGPFAPEQGPIDLILKKLDAILEAVTAPPPPEPSEVTLRTSAGLFGIHLLDCLATNVSTRTIEIVIRRKNVVGTDLAVTPSTVGPGHTVGSATFTAENVQRCEFTFTGFADEVRANMFVRAQTTGEIAAVFEAR